MSNESRPLHELIGDLSEGLLYASYNEDHIRIIWREGRINETAQELSHWDKPRFESQMDGWVVENEDYQALLDQKVREAGGWAPHWSSCPEDLSPLTEEEKELMGRRQAA